MKKLLTSRHLPGDNKLHYMGAGKHHLQAFSNGEFLVISDAHFDSPHCHRKHLKRELDRCLKDGIPVLLNGDWFDVMGAMRDPRSAKGGVLPEYDRANYFDLVIEDAIEFFKPYRNLLLGYVQGNHESAILKHQETDPQKRFVYGLGFDKDVAEMLTLGYTGSLHITAPRADKTPGGTTSTNIYYHHGKGGNAPMTGGAITLRRTMMSEVGYDLYIFGHKHISEWDCLTTTRIDRLGRPHKVAIQGIHVPSLKDTRWLLEGWEVEKGFAPPVIGTVSVLYHAIYYNGEFGRENKLTLTTKTNIAHDPYFA